MPMPSPRPRSRSSPTRTSVFTRWKERFARALPRIPRAMPARALPFLLLCASCAVPLSAPQPPEVCYIPRAQLQPTAPPSLQDETYGDLRREADSDRKALGVCNSDKSIALQLLEKQNLQRKASETASKP